MLEVLGRVCVKVFEVIERVRKGDGGPWVRGAVSGRLYKSVGQWGKRLSMCECARSLWEGE